MSNPSFSSTPGVDFLSFVFEHQEQSHDGVKPIFIDAENSARCLSYNQTKALVRKTIAGLKASGLHEGECVLLALPNNFLYSSIYFSIIGAGGVYIGANPASQVFELDHILQLAEPRIIITTGDVLPKILQTTVGSKFPEDRLFVLDSSSFPLPVLDELPASPPRSRPESPSECESKAYSDFLALITYGESDWMRFNDIGRAKSTPAAMFSTSGTSGLPKAAVSSHYALVCQHLSMESAVQYDVSRLISLPLFHVFAALFAHVWPIRLGQPLYVLPRFQLEQFVTAIQRFKITDTVMAPPIVHTLNQMSPPPTERLQTMRWIGVGGAPIAAEAMKQFESILDPSATLSQVWGMTEIGVSTLIRFPERQCWGSIGRPLEGYEMRLIDSFGGIVTADHEPGEMEVRYRGMMTGYKNQLPQVEGEWYSTGDIMTRADGKYFVVGRSKELIKVNGWQVAPAELEAVLLSHPCIGDAGVIGSLREDSSTEVPRAYIVRKGDSEGRCSSLSAKEIYDYSRKRLASYKALDGGIFFVNDIPRTASGKIQRFKLARMDNYRRSVTELLVRNNDMISEQRRDKIVDLKARADEVRTGNRRSSGIASAKLSTQGSVIPREGYQTAQTRRRSRTSLADKIKALEASSLATVGVATSDMSK